MGREPWAPTEFALLPSFAPDSAATESTAVASQTGSSTADSWSVTAHQVTESPFLDWLHGADTTNEDLTLAGLRREPTVYLLPECENGAEARQRSGRFSGSM